MEFSGPPLRPLPAGFVRDFFAYTVNVLFTGAGQRVPVTLQLDGSADFEMVEVSASTTETPAPPVMALVNIKDTATGYSLFNDQVPVDHFATTLVRRIQLTATHLFRSNASIQFDVTNQGAATPRLFLTLKGFKWWQVANSPAQSRGGNL